MALNPQDIALSTNIYNSDIIQACHCVDQLGVYYDKSILFMKNFKAYFLVLNFIRC